MASITNLLFPPILPAVLPGFHDYLDFTFEYPLANDVTSFANFAFIRVQDTNTMEYQELKNYIGDKQVGYLADIQNRDQVTRTGQISLRDKDAAAVAWDNNHYYNIQVCLVSVELEEDKPTNAAGVKRFLDENKTKISEWSSKAVLNPVYPIAKIATSSKIAMYDDKIAGLAFGFARQEEKDNNWTKIDNITSVLLSVDCGVTYKQLPLVNGNNSLILGYSFFSQEEFTSISENRVVLLKIYTASGYMESYSCKLVGISQRSTELNKYSYGLLNPDENCIDFYWKQDSTSQFMLLRTSEEFGVENLYYCHTVVEQPANSLFFRDLTLAANTNYQYYIVRYRSSDDSPVEKIMLTDDETILPEPTMTKKPYQMPFNYTSLVSQNCQLMTPYDIAIDNISFNQQTNIIPTIGTQFPFIYINDNVQYRTFNLSGTISAFMDEEFYVYSNEDIDYWKQHNIQNHTNYKKEFLFRQKVINFLMNKSPKLFKSETEGNMVIFLTDVTVTPMAQLSRMIYTFSATCTEIANPTMDNFYKYKIVDNIRDDFGECGNWDEVNLRVLSWMNK